MRVMYNYFDPSGLGKVKLAVEEVSYVFLDEKSSLVCFSSDYDYIESMEPIDEKNYTFIMRSLMRDGYCDLTPYGTFRRESIVDVDIDKEIDRMKKKYSEVIKNKVNNFE